MEKEKWCGHLAKYVDGKFYLKTSAQPNLPGSPLEDKPYEGEFCKYCGKPRPKEPKGLAEILKEAWWSKKSDGFAPSVGGYEREADAAINWMREIVESKEKEFQESGSSHMNGYVISGMIKDELKRKVKGE